MRWRRWSLGWRSSARALSPILPAPWIVSLVLVSVTPLPRRNARAAARLHGDRAAARQRNVAAKIDDCVGRRAIDEERPVVGEGGVELRRRAGRVV